MVGQVAVRRQPRAGRSTPFFTSSSIASAMARYFGAPGPQDSAATLSSPQYTD